MPEAIAPVTATTTAPQPSEGLTTTKPPQTSQTSTNSQPGTKTPAKTAAADPQLHEMKWNGKTERVSLETMRKRAELAEGANERFQQAAALTKKAEATLGRLRDPKNAIAFLQDPALGLSKDEVVKEFEVWYAENVIKREKMSPEQRELSDAKVRIQKYEEEEKARKDTELKTQEEKEDAQVREQLQTEIKDVIETSGLPKTRFVAQQIAKWMRINEEKGLNAPRELIIQQVRKDLRQVMDSLVQSSDGEVLANLLGAETAHKLRKHDLTKLRESRQKLGQGSTETTHTETKPQKKISYAEVNRNFRKLRIGR